MSTSTITVAQFVKLDPSRRPNVTYNGQPVTNVYRDPSYSSKERYVIRCGTSGCGSKQPDTELRMTQARFSDHPLAERDELILFLEEQPIDVRRAMFIPNGAHAVISAALDYLDDELPCFIPTKSIRQIVLDGAKQHITQATQEIANA